MEILQIVVLLASAPLGAQPFPWGFSDAPPPPRSAVGPVVPSEKPCAAPIAPPALRAANRSERERRFKLVRQDADVIVVIYEGEPLDRAVQALNGDFAVEEVRRAGAATEELVAVTRINQQRGGRRTCRGLLRVDDPVAPAMNVVGLLESGVLVASPRALFFVPVGERDPLTFRLVWRSSFSFVFPRPPTTAPPRPAKRR